MAATADTVAIDDYWDAEIVDEAPGARFVYAMAMHQALSQYYPPVPVNSAAMVLNGVELDSLDKFANDPTYAMGTASLYWYSNRYGFVPWPRNWVSISNPGSASYTQKMLFHFIRMGMGPSGLVTSLQPAPNSPLRITQCNTNTPATTGDLMIDVNLSLQDDAANLSGFQVFKSVDGNKLRKGPVVERIVSDGSIVVTSAPGAPAGSGVVLLSSGIQQFSGEFEEVALENAKQELLGMFPYIKLLGWDSTSSSNKPSGFVAKFRVPHILAVGSKYKVLVYFTVFGTADIAGTIKAKQYAGVKFSYTVLPDYTPINANDDFKMPPGSGIHQAWNSMGATLPSGMLTMTAPIQSEIPFGYYSGNPALTIYKAYDPMLVHNDAALGADSARKQVRILGGAIPVSADLASWNTGVDGEPYVKPGSLVGIRVSRAGLLSSNKEYTSPIGFINLYWKLQPVV